MLRASFAAALLSLAVVPLVAPIAHADDGVTVDDNSPSAKEYAIPLDEARSNAAGGSSRSGSDGVPEAFGQGVTAPERPSPSPSKPARKNTKKDRTSTTTEPSSSAQEADPTRTVAATPAGGDSGSSSGQALAGGAALVIVAGGAAGLWARRRQPAGEPG